MASALCAGWNQGAAGQAQARPSQPQLTSWGAPVPQPEAETEWGGAVAAEEGE